MTEIVSRAVPQNPPAECVSVAPEKATVRSRGTHNDVRVKLEDGGDIKMQFFIDH